MSNHFGDHVVVKLSLLMLDKLTVYVTVYLLGCPPPWSTPNRDQAGTLAVKRLHKRELLTSVVSTRLRVDPVRLNVRLARQICTYSV